MAKVSLKSLYKSEKGFKRVADLMSEPIWMADADGTVIWVNKCYRKLTGIQREIIRPEDWKEYAEPAELKSLFENFSRHLHKNKKWKEVFSLKAQNGKKQWFLANADPVLDENGELLRWLGFNTDITKQKEIEEQLLLQKERYELATSSTLDAIWDWDLKEDLIHWSPSMEHIFGYTSDKTSGDWAIQRFHPEDKERVSSMISDVIEKKKKSWSAEFRFRKKNDEYAHVLDRGYLLFDKQERPVRMIGSMADMTWQKRAIKELEEAKVAAENANAAKSAFLANVSHEVRSPLSAILGYVELMKTVDMDKKGLCDFLQVVERSGQQVLRILDDVLDLAKVESGALEIHKTEFPLDELLDDMRMAMGEKARTKGVNFSISKEGNIPDVLLSDPVRIRQIIINMLGNAIKFTEEGEVNLKLVYERPCLRLIVSDTGIGIPRDKRKSIFEPFNQGEASVSRNYGGSGLGLSLTKKLCEAMEGNFFLVKSEVGAGSVFEANIRVDEGLDRRDERHGGAKAGCPLKGKRLLVIDDSAEIRMLVQKLLERTGAKVDVASGGEKGLQMALSANYDMILLDIQMPDMDGYETLDVLKEAGVKAPVVALTAHAMKEERERAMSAGFSSFVTKPMNVDNIVDTLGHL